MRYAITKLVTDTIRSVDSITDVLKRIEDAITIGTLVTGKSSELKELRDKLSQVETEIITKFFRSAYLVSLNTLYSYRRKVNEYTFAHALSAIDNIVEKAIRELEIDEKPEYVVPYRFIMSETPIKQRSKTLELTRQLILLSKALDSQ